MKISKAIVELARSVIDLAVFKRRVDVRESVRRELRRAVCKELHIKQFEATEQDITKALIPMFEDQIKSMVERLRALEGKSFEKSIEDQAITIADQIFNPAEWRDDLIDRALPVLALAMVRAAVAQMDVLGVNVRTKSPEFSFNRPKRLNRAELARDGIKATTATEWLDEHPNDWDELIQAVDDVGLPIQIMTEIPPWMQKGISKQLTNTFSKPYWDDIHKATKGVAEKILRKGLAEGFSIRRMATEMATKFGGDTRKYAKIRATRIARTESGHALNGARRASMDQLAEDLGPQVPMKPSWLSVLGDTTRDTHAMLDGVPADENGLWNLAETLVPWPAHSSLPPGERVNCQCTIITEFGMDETEARRLIQEHQARVEGINQPEADKPVERDVVFPPEERGSSRKIGKFSKVDVSPEVRRQGKILETNIENNENIGVAITEYTNEEFRGINSRLRENEELNSLQSRFVTDLDTITSIPLGKSTTVYRGVGFKGAQYIENAERVLKEGGIISDKAYWSTSLDPEISSEFTKFKNPVMLQIRTNKGAFLNENVSRISGESEVLLPRGSKFRVLGIDRNITIEGVEDIEFTVIRLEAA